MRSFYSSTIANLIIFLLPSTRLFEVKRIFLNFLGFEIGRDVKITGGVRFYGRGHIKIEDRSWIGIGTVFINANARVLIGANCDIAPYVVVHTGTHAIGSSERRAGIGESYDINIESGVWIGTGSKILAGTVIGYGSIVAAGAVTRGVIPSNVMVAGVPAKIKKAL